MSVMILDDGSSIIKAKIAQELRADFFLAHPYAAWERGTNENMNSLIR